MTNSKPSFRSLGKLNQLRVLAAKHRRLTATTMPESAFYVPVAPAPAPPMVAALKAPTGTPVVYLAGTFQLRKRAKPAAVAPICDAQLHSLYEAGLALASSL